MSNITATPLEQYVDLVARKRDLESEVNLIKKQLAPLEAQLIDDLAEEGLRSKTTAGGVTVYLNRKIYARAGELGKPAACKALREVGLGDLVEESFNTNTLSAHFRQIAKDYIAEHGHGATLDDLLPEPLRGAIHLSEDHRLGLTRG